MIILGGRTFPKARNIIKDDANSVEKFGSCVRQSMSWTIWNWSIGLRGNNPKMVEAARANRQWNILGFFCVFSHSLRFSFLSLSLSLFFSLSLSLSFSLSLSLSNLSLFSSYFFFSSSFPLIWLIFAACLVLSLSLFLSLSLSLSPKFQLRFNLSLFYLASAFNVTHAECKVQR